MAPAAASDKSTSPSTFQGNWRASKMVGLSVYNEKNESVGSINDFLTDKNGKITAVDDRRRRIPRRRRASRRDPVREGEVLDRAGRLYRHRCAARLGGTAGRSTTTTGAATTAPAAAAKPNPWYPDHAVFNATKEELKAMPEFKYAT